MVRPLSNNEVLGWVITVDRQNRLRFPSGIESRLPWLAAGESKAAWIAVGPFRQLLVYPDQKRENAVQQAAKLLAARPLSRKDVRSSAAEAIRRLGSSWMVTLNYESAGRRFTLTLPREARLLKLCPPPAGVVVAYPQGGFIEIWSRDDWLAHETKAEHSDSEGIQDEIEGEWPEE
jgi:DNA-binding transcriptional regulator/RsmH inhibitor MraZ